MPTQCNEAPTGQWQARNFLSKHSAEPGKLIVGYVARIIFRNWQPPDMLVDVSLILTVGHEWSNQLRDYRTIHDCANILTLVAIDDSAPIERVVDQRPSVLYQGSCDVHAGLSIYDTVLCWRQLVDESVTEIETLDEGEPLA